MGWPHLGPSRRGRGCGGPHSERTGGPAPGTRRTRRVGQDRLAGAGGAGTAAAAADLQGVAGAGLAQGQEPAEADGAPRGAVVPDGGGRPRSPRRRSGGGEAGGSLGRGSPVRAGAASTKSRRFSTAGWAGRGRSL